MIKLKGSEEDLRIQVQKKMLLLIINSMKLRRDLGHNRERSRLEVIVGDYCSV